jgi:hypothetical protein
MKSSPLITGVIFLALLQACSMEAVRPEPTAIAYQLRIVPNDSLRRFELNIQSLSSGPLCIKVSNWPDDNGRLLSDSSAVVEIDSGTISPVSSELGRENCVTGCDAIEIKRGQSLVGVVNYAAFGDPAKVAGIKDKKLVMRSDPHACSKSDYESSENPSLKSLCENGLTSCELTK